MHWHRFLAASRLWLGREPRRSARSRLVSAVPSSAKMHRGAIDRATVGRIPKIGGTLRSNRSFTRFSETGVASCQVTGLGSPAAVDANHAAPSDFIVSLAEAVQDNKQSRIVYIARAAADAHASDPRLVGKRGLALAAAALALRVPGADSDDRELLLDALTHVLTKGGSALFISFPLAPVINDMVRSCIEESQAAVATWGASELMERLVGAGFVPDEAVLSLAVGSTLQSMDVDSALRLLRLCDKVMDFDVRWRTYLAVYDHCKASGQMSALQPTFDAVATLGLPRHAAAAGVEMDQGNIVRATELYFHASYSGMGFGVDQFVRLCKLHGEGAGGWDAIYRLLWAYVRNRDGDFKSWSDCMRIITDMHESEGGSGGELHASVLERRVATTHRRARLLLYMVHGGFEPNVLTFKAALGMGNMRLLRGFDGAAADTLREMNEGGAMGTLCSLWAAVCLAIDARRLDLASEFLRRNIESAIVDTDDMLRARGARPWIPGTGGEKERRLLPLLCIQDIQNQDLAFIWNHLLSEYYWLAKRSAGGIAQFDRIIKPYFSPSYDHRASSQQPQQQQQQLSGVGLLSHAARQRAHFLDSIGVAVLRTSPAFAGLVRRLSERGRPNLMVQSNLNLVLSKLLKECDMEPITSLGFDAIRRGSYSYKTVNIVLKACVHLNLQDQFVSTGLQAAVSIIESDPLANSLWSRYNIYEPENAFSRKTVSKINALYLNWFDRYRRGDPSDCMKASLLLRETARSLLERALEEEEEAPRSVVALERSKRIDGFNAVLIAQLAGALNCSWRPLIQYMSRLLTYSQSDVLNADAGHQFYINKLLWTAHMLVKSGVYESRGVVQNVLGYFESHDFTEGLLSLWRAHGVSLASAAAHPKVIETGMRVLFSAQNFVGIVSAGKVALNDRGSAFAKSFLMRKGAVSMLARGIFALETEIANSLGYGFPLLMDRSVALGTSMHPAFLEGVAEGLAGALEQEDGSPELWSTALSFVEGLLDHLHLESQRRLPVDGSSEREDYAAASILGRVAHSFGPWHDVLRGESNDVSDSGAPHSASPPPRYCLGAADRVLRVLAWAVPPANRDAYERLLRCQVQRKAFEDSL